MKRALPPFCWLLLGCLACGCDGRSVALSDGASPDAGPPADAGGDASIGNDPEAFWRYPAGFLFGTATAGFQVDMGCPTLPKAQCADVNSDWYAYMTTPALLTNPHTYLNGDDPAVTGPGHWELYPQDHALARDTLKNNAFRMSLEWSRIFPASTEGVEEFDALRAIASADALAGYHAIFASLRAHGLTPLVTIHHYTLPLWIHDGAGCTIDLKACTSRGWLEPGRIVPEIAKYAGFVAREFGGEVDLWATLNEPFAVVLSGFLQPSKMRSNPPAQMLDAADAKTALFAMIDAHARMVDAVRAGDTVDADGDGRAASVGLVYAMAPVIPKNVHARLDREAAKNTFYLWDMLFLDAAVLGLTDPGLDGMKTYREDLAGRMDFVGLNYYQSIIVEGMDGSLLPDLSPMLTLNPFTLDSSQMHPRGLYEMLAYLAGRYRLPVIITENNGTQMWNGDVAAEARYMTENLQYVLLAIDRGADVRGYFYWSFMDNIEWNLGMSGKFGLFAVDPSDPTKARTPRATVPLYAEIAGSASVPPALRQTYPIDLNAPATGGVPAPDLFLP